MTRSRSHAISLMLACFVLAAAPSYASRPTGHLVPDIHQKKSHDINSPRMQAAREQAKAELSGQVTPLSENTGGWTSKYSLYVGCTTSPAGKTYTTIQAALNVALPYTTVYVCPGMYSGDNAVNTDFVEIRGVSPYQGAETVTCGTTPTPTDNSYGFDLNGSYQHVKNLTINDCEFGAITEYGGYQKDNEVSFSFFNDDYYGVYTDGCAKCEVEDSKFQSNYFPVYTYFDVKDYIHGNTILGDGTGHEYGILIEDSVSDQIVSNTVSATYAGLAMESYNDFALVESNHFDGNEYGVHIYFNNSGNTFEGNYANGNTDDGFYTEDATNGVDATPNSGPDRFLSNHATGNGTYDYYDATIGYAGNNSSTNAGTADYYKGNKGNTAYPGAIFFH